MQHKTDQKQSLFNMSIQLVIASNLNAIVLLSIETVK